MGWLPQIPVRLLPDDMTVRVPDGMGGFSEGVVVRRVRFVRAQSASDDGHRFADAGAGRIYIDAVNSIGGFCMPVGARVEIGAASYFVWRVRACEGFRGAVHHWEVDVR